jgi:flagellar biosynthesis chaperone FliJ
MQAFRFRLEKVLDWYAHQCELEERRFALCLAALAAAQQAIAQLQAERLGIERDLVSRQTIPAREFVALGLYRLRAKQREVELNTARDQREAEVREQRLRVQAAQRRLRLLEKLRERRITEYDYAATRELENLAADAYFSKWASSQEVPQ